MPLKIDLHTHILPENWPDLREKYGYGGFVSLEHHQPCCAKMMIDGKTIGCEITIDEAKSIRRWLKFGWDELRRIIQTELRKVG